MSKRKKCHAVQPDLADNKDRKDQDPAPTMLEVSQGRTIVNRLKVRRQAAQPLLGIIERVVQLTSQTMTLVSKLGSLVVLKSELVKSPFVLDRTFWRWCMQAVTTLRNKCTFNKKVKVPAGKPFKSRPFNPIEQTDTETDEAYALRCKQEATTHDQHEQERRCEHTTQHEVESNQKAYFRDLIVDTWQEIRPHIAILHDRANLTDTFETQIAAYITNIEVNVITTLAKRIKSAIKHQIAPLLKAVHAWARKNLEDALTDWVIRRIQGQPPPEWQTYRRNLCDTFVTEQTWQDLAALSESHRQLLPADVPEGFLDDSKYLQKNAAHFIGYLGFLSRNSAKLFVILPQIQPRARHIKLDRRTLREILAWADNKALAESESFYGDTSLATESKDRWSEERGQAVMLDLFHMPNVGKLLKHAMQFEGTFTTDGVKACWFFTRRVKKQIFKKSAKAATKRETRPKKRQKKQTTSKKNERPKKTTTRTPKGPDDAVSMTDVGEETKDDGKEWPVKKAVPIKLASDLKPGIYEHGLDFWLEPNDPNKRYVFVDPGHVNIMSCVVEECGQEFHPKTAPRFSLTNRWYRAQTGMTQRKRQSEARIEKNADMKAAMDDLAAHSCKTWDPGVFAQHIAAMLRHWSTLFTHAFNLRERYDRFSAYQAKQRVVDKIITLLAGTGDPKQTVLVVGSGVSKATSRGHESAPGKELRTSLSARMPVIMTPEHYTTKMSCCCHAPVVHGRYDLSTAKKSTQARIRGLSHCTQCRTTLNRDHSSAVNIRTVFWYQATGRSRGNPLKPDAQVAGTR